MSLFNLFGQSNILENDSQADKIIKLMSTDPFSKEIKRVIDENINILFSCTNRYKFRKYPVHLINVMMEPLYIKDEEMGILETVPNIGMKHLFWARYILLNTNILQTDCYIPNLFGHESIRKMIFPNLTGDRLSLYIHNTDICIMDGNLEPFKEYVFNTGKLYPLHMILIKSQNSSNIKEVYQYHNMLDSLKTREILSNPNILELFLDRGVIMKRNVMLLLDFDITEEILDRILMNNNILSEYRYILEEKNYPMKILLNSKYDNVWRIEEYRRIFVLYNKYFNRWRINTEINRKKRDFKNIHSEVEFRPKTGKFYVETSENTRIGKK